jgi:hypothetical protein
MRKAANCIVYLVKDDDQHISNFKLSLQSLVDNALATILDSDLIIGVDDEDVISRLEIPELFHVRFFLTNWKDKLENQQLNPDQYPKKFPFPPKGEYSEYSSEGFGLGYRMMCRFYSGAMYFEYPIFDDYEYYLRLDTDSKIDSAIEDSLFRLMKRRQAVYGFYAPANQKDDPFVTRGLHEWLRSYFASQTWLTWVRFLSKVARNEMYYTNFELGYFPAFRGLKYQNFFRAIDQSGGILMNRWGDAPIKYAAVRTLFPRRRVVGIRNFSYSHGHSWARRSEFYWSVRAVLKPAIWLSGTLVRKLQNLKDL